MKILLALFVRKYGFNIHQQFLGGRITNYFKFSIVGYLVDDKTSVTIVVRNAVDDSFFDHFKRTH